MVNHSFLQYCLTELVQRILNCDKIQESYSRDMLNILIYGSPFCATIYTSYELCKMISFLAHSVYGRNILSRPTRSIAGNILF